MNVIEYFRMGEVGIHCEITWNLMLNHPIDQFDAQIGVIPEPPHVFDQFAFMIDQQVVNRDHAMRRVAGLTILLQNIESTLVQLLLIPRDGFTRSVCGVCAYG